MKKESAINYLLYVILGVTVGDEFADPACKDTIDNDQDRIKAAIIRAYSDATIQGAYSSLFKGPLKESLAKHSDNAKKEAARLILKELDNYFRDDSNCEHYAKWHHELCRNLVSIYSKVTDGTTAFFTYGNAQKWVNMTVKYMCVIDALSEDFVYQKRIRESQNHLHVPIDSYIIEAVWDEPSIQLPLKDQVVRHPNKYKNPHERVEAWSTWNLDEPGNQSTDNLEEPRCSAYDHIQEGIQDTIQESPLDWETRTWIVQAKKRRLHTKTSLRQKYRHYF